MSERQEMPAVIQLHKVFDGNNSTVLETAGVYAYHGGDRPEQAKFHMEATLRKASVERNAP